MALGASLAFAAARAGILDGLEVADLILVRFLVAAGIMLPVLVLLRHKLGRLREAFERAQQGHRGTLLTSAKISRRRRVAIELGM